MFYLLVQFSSYVYLLFVRCKANVYAFEKKSVCSESSCVPFKIIFSPYTYLHAHTLSLSLAHTPSAKLLHRSVFGVETENVLHFLHIIISNRQYLLAFWKKLISAAITIERTNQTTNSHIIKNYRNTRKMVDTTIHTRIKTPNDGLRYSARLRLPFSYRKYIYLWINGVFFSCFECYYCSGNNIFPPVSIVPFVLHWPYYLFVHSRLNVYLCGELTFFFSEWKKTHMPNSIGNPSINIRGNRFVKPWMTRYFVAGPKANRITV